MMVMGKKLKIKDKDRFMSFLMLVVMGILVVALYVQAENNPRQSEEEFLNKTYLETPVTTETAVKPEVVPQAKVVRVEDYNSTYDDYAARYAGEKLKLKEGIVKKVVREGKKKGLRTDLIFCMISLESDGNPNEVNPSSNATGLMQVMEVTYDWLSPYKGNFERDMKDPYKNIEVGTKTLHTFLKMYKGDLQKALYSYGGCVSSKAKRRYMKDLNDRYRALYGYNLTEVLDEIEIQWNIKYKRSSKV